MKICLNQHVTELRDAFVNVCRNMFSFFLFLCIFFIEMCFFVTLIVDGE